MKELEFIDDTPAWRKIDGDLIKIMKMSDSHILNTIIMLRRMHDQKISCVIVCDSMENAIESCDNAGPEFTCHKAYPRLLEEALFRGLKLTR